MQQNWRFIAILFVFSACPMPADVDAGALEGTDSGNPAAADGGPDSGADDAGLKNDSGMPDSGVDGGTQGADAGKEVGCATTFGSALTDAFGRVDGVVTAVVPPGTMWCALPNSDHVVLQVAFADAGVHRMVINVQSNGADPRIRVLQLEAPLPPPAFQEGWHPGLMLDYPTAFGVHADAGWESVDMPTASRRIYDAIDVGAAVSVYASSSGGTRAASAHLIHRNGSNTDGALVLDPKGPRPRWMLFSFANQRF